MKVFVGIILAAGLVMCSAPQEKFDHSKFDEILRTHVDTNGIVDYSSIRNDERFQQYLESIEQADVSEYSQNENLAFYINAYNAAVIKNVLNHYPINSPMSVDGFFKKFKFTIAGEDLSLDEIEHKKVMKIEPVLIHFGLVCAAVSCPKLLAEVYRPETVFAQLEKNARVFLNDKSKNRLDRDSKTLYLSAIFNWFKKYFIERYGSLKNVAAAFMNESDSAFIQQNEIQIAFLKYNWKLNSK